MEIEKTYRVGEAARLLNMDRLTIYQAIREGALETFRPWSRGDQRIRHSELIRWQTTRVYPPKQEAG